MAIINIKIYPEEKERILKVIKKHRGKTMSVSAIAKEAGQNPNRARFVIEELLQEGKIVRTPTKAYNPRYIRYSYDIVK